MRKLTSKVMLLFTCLCLCSVAVCCGGAEGDGVSTVFRYKNATAIGGLSDDYANASCTDGAGGIWITGSYKGTITFGSDVLTSLGGEDIFVARINSEGNPVAAISIGNSGDDKATEICADGLGGCWFTGMFSGTCSFGTETRVASGGADIFAAHLNSDLSWGGVCTGGSDSSNPEAEYSYGICSDGTSGCWITGYFTVSFNMGSDTLVPTGSTVNKDMFVAHGDDSGNWVGSIAAGSTGNEVGSSVSYDGDGGCFVSGYFSGTTSFGIVELFPDFQLYSGTMDIFIAKVHSSAQWNGAVSPISNVMEIGEINSLKLFPDTSNGVMICGNYTSTLTCGSKTFVSTGALGAFEMFVARLDSSLSWVFVNVATNTIASNVSYADGFFWVCGLYQGIAWFDSFYFNTSGTEMFIAAISGNGAWTKAVTTLGYNGGVPTDMTFNGIDGLWVSGFFSDTIDFGDTTLNSNGNSDIFIANSGLVDI